MDKSYTFNMYVANDLSKVDQTNHPHLTFFYLVFEVRIQDVVKGQKKKHFIVL
jgi:hypothetical protein